MLYIQVHLNPYNHAYVTQPIFATWCGSYCKCRNFVFTVFHGLNFRGDKLCWARLAHRNVANSLCVQIFTGLIFVGIAFPWQLALHENFCVYGSCEPTKGYIIVLSEYKILQYQEHNFNGECISLNMTGKNNYLGFWKSFTITRLI